MDDEKRGDGLAAEIDRARRDDGRQIGVPAKM
jgi:hypothetical protein